eukprot:CAMPEP_0198546798 /NCGR_PEP_ID=MMETSP1462-20131121/67208_1 /TAXON_ID=1333877 /ORGANISM="Brandtodinium nutriculum, Strain RCC3387" /LENGTH=85 /DNA_ID=CAMNT_0044277255 /DNA_START=13 /DNA_END=266 /DNA_ORIENTATION=+
MACVCSQPRIASGFLANFCKLLAVSGLPSTYCFTSAQVASSMSGIRVISIVVPSLMVKVSVLPAIGVTRAACPRDKVLGSGTKRA